MSQTSKKTRSTAILGIFSAIIIVLQLMSYFIKIGTFNLSLVLIPVVLGAYLYGAKTGAILGGVFGITVTVCCFAGLDGGGYILVQASPVITSAVCIVKGVAAGLCAGLVGSAFKSKKPYLAIMASAIVAPLVNTGLFVSAMFLFFKDILAQWSGGANIITYAIVGLVGVNFIIELVLNVAMAPAMLRVSKALKI
ncbi:MAG: ECF transporter S component [Ruminococcaceae bacterium]|nr:ECF transporter S component [Oscillospiraceae bacterium]